MTVQPAENKPLVVVSTPSIYTSSASLEEATTTNKKDSNRHECGTTILALFGIVGVVVVSILLVVVVATTTTKLSWRGRFHNRAAQNDSNGTCLGPDPPPYFSPLGYSNAAVSSDQGRCSVLGRNFLLFQPQATVMDAAVVVALCIGVVNPASSGLGGGAFLLVHAPLVTMSNETEQQQQQQVEDARSSTNMNDNTSASGRTLEAIDCREQAPGRATTNMYNDTGTESILGPRAVSAFGELHCLFVGHQRFGSVPWKDLVEFVIEQFEHGSVVVPYLAQQIQSLAVTCQKDPNVVGCESDGDGGLRGLLTRDDNWKHPLKQGEILHNVALVETLRRVAVDGPDAIYQGPTAHQIANEIQARGGILTANDLQSYRAVLRSPVIARNVNGFALAGVPPPSSGGATILGAARFLAGFDIPLATFADTLTMHRMLEAFKHVFAIRMSLSDPKYNASVVEAAVRDLVETNYIARLRNESYSDDHVLGLSNYGGSKWAQLLDSDGKKPVQDVVDGHEGDRRRLVRKYGYLEDSGTSHFNIVDRFGNAVAMTSSVNTNFGSRVRSPSTGILFSNTMDDFASPGQPDFFGLKPAEANYILPYKRPLSSMAPTMMFRQKRNGELGDLMVSIGASGGPKIITAVLQVLLHHVFMGKPLKEAILHSRLHNQLVYHGADVTAAEHDCVGRQHVDVSARTRDALARRGQDVMNFDYPGTVQAISIDSETGTLTAVCDPRKQGSPAGY